jgi:uncharacterized protein YegP (UPF0339 family)
MKRRARFVVYKDVKGEWRWQLRAANGRIIADSGEGYKQRHKAMTAMYRISKLCRTGDYNYSHD